MPVKSGNVRLGKLFAQFVDHELIRRMMNAGHYFRKSCRSFAVECQQLSCVSEGVEAPQVEIALEASHLWLRRSRARSQTHRHSHHARLKQFLARAKATFAAQGQHAVILDQHFPAHSTAHIRQRCNARHRRQR